MGSKKLDTLLKDFEIQNNKVKKILDILSNNQKIGPKHPLTKTLSNLYEFNLYLKDLTEQSKEETFKELFLAQIEVEMNETERFIELIQDSLSTNNSFFGKLKRKRKLSKLSKTIIKRLETFKKTTNDCLKLNNSSLNNIPPEVWKK